jgi:hypothetical protein
VVLNFFRKSKNGIFEGKPSYSDFFTKVCDVFGVELNFSDSPKYSDPTYQRIVSLENIIYHNPDVYAEITSCVDLLGCCNPHLEISYSDIHPDARDLVDQAYLSSQCEERVFDF